MSEEPFRVRPSLQLLMGTRSMLLVRNDLGRRGAPAGKIEGHVIEGERHERQEDHQRPYAA